MLACGLCIFFGEMSVKIFGQFLIRLFVFLLASIKHSSCILDNSSLSGVSFANIFSQSGLSSLNSVFHRSEVSTF